MPKTKATLNKTEQNSYCTSNSLSTVMKNEEVEEYDLGQYKQALSPGPVCTQTV